MHLTAEEIIRALKSKQGFVTLAAKALNVTPQAIYKRIRTNKTIERAVEEIKESHLDFAESQLLRKIKSEDLGAICFYLKCKGKDRGYIEKAQIEHSTKEGQSLGIKFIPSKDE